MQFVRPLTVEKSRHEVTLYACGRTVEDDCIGLAAVSSILPTSLLQLPMLIRRREFEARPAAATTRGTKQQNTAPGHSTDRRSTPGPAASLSASRRRTAVRRCLQFLLLLLLRARRRLCAGGCGASDR